MNTEPVMTDNFTNFQISEKWSKQICSFTQRGVLFHGINGLLKMQYENFSYIRIPPNLHL